MKALTREQIREIDRRAIEEYGIAGVVLMENAGRNAAEIIIDRLERPGRPPVCILCGGGNNGGDGFVIARHLHNKGFPVRCVLLGDPERLSPDAKINHDIARKMQLSIERYDKASAEKAIRSAQIVVDALLGTGFSGEVRSPVDEAISLINSADHAMRVAVDVPSGLDCNTGAAAEATVRADLTVTFVASKVGFAEPDAKQYTGEVVVADIGAPRELLNQA